MGATASVSPIRGTGVTDVIDAMRSIQSEDDRWHLAEELAKIVPDGQKGFDVILDRASKEGVGGYKVHTLRLYRDTAKRWPASKRVANVSFSAHREAMAASTNSPTIEPSRKLLESLAKQHGAKGVSVQRVREAVQIKNGTKRQGGRRTPKGAANATPAPPPQIDTLADLANGAPKIIAGIVETDPRLDKYQSGLTKALGHVERLRAKVARKAASKKTPPAAPAKAAPVAKKAPVKKARGDLRGL